MNGWSWPRPSPAPPPTAPLPEGVGIQPFTIDVPDEDLDDLRRRLHDTRRPDAEVVDDWSQGIPLA